MRIFSLILVAAFLASSATLADDFSPAYGPGCDTPEAVKALYAQLDKIPDSAPIEAVFVMIRVMRDQFGVPCEWIVEPELLAYRGVVDHFVRLDGRVMEIIQFDRPSPKKPTFSWRLTSEQGL